MDKVLSLLIHQKGFVSGQEIALLENISRTAIWKHIKKAREEGFIISSSPNKGYRVEKFPDNRIVPELIEYYYNGPLPYEIVYINTLSSTNSYAKELILKGKQNSFIVVTDEQKKGRGRYERVWISEKGRDLTFSIVLSTDINIKEFYKMTVVAGLAIMKALTDTVRPYNIPDRIMIKWPNDIMIGGKKICGMLSEMITEEQRINHIVIGIGINVNSSPRAEKAVSLYNIIHRETDRNMLMSLIIRVFNSLVLELGKGHYGEIFREWKSGLGWLGETVSFNDGQSLVKGILKDIDENGALVIKTGEGEKTYYSGDLFI